MTGKSTENPDTFNVPANGNTLPSYLRRIVEAVSLKRYHQMKQDIAARRQELEVLRRRNIYSEELIRQKEFELDLEQISLKLA